MIFITWCADFSTPVLGGTNFMLNNETVKAGPIIVYAYDPTDAYSRYMWSSDDSVQNFLTSTPSTTRYLFLSYGGKALHDPSVLLDYRNNTHTKNLAFF
jgi:hypothetical protein